MKKLNQNGFTLVAALLIFLIVGAIGFAGYYVYNEQTKKDTKNVDSSQGTQATEAQPETDKDVENAEPEQKYLEIKEWGVKIPLNELTENATYKIVEVEDSGGYAELYVKLTDDYESSSCNNQANIGRVLPSEIGKIDDFIWSKEYIEESSVKIGENYYSTSPSQAACTDDKELQEQATEVRSYWVEQAKNIVAID